MIDLIIIGGGFWGISCALRAKEQNKSVLVFDDRDPQAASRNATCMIKWGWYSGTPFKKLCPDNWTDEDIVESFRWLSKYVELESTGQNFYNFSDNFKKKTFQDDVVLMELPESLLNQVLTINEKVEMIKETKEGWRVNGKNCKNLIIAAGYRTDELLIKNKLPGVGIGKDLGIGLILNREAVHTPTTWCVRPFVQYTMRKWGDKIRFGETKNLEPMKKYINRFIGESEIVEEKRGYRPKAKKFTIQAVRKNLVVISGGYKFGLVIAGLVSKEAMCKLKF